MSKSRLDLLTRFPWLKEAIKSRLWQPAAMLLTLSFFVLVILTSLLGTPAGSKNFGIIFVWIVWWALLIIVLIPFFGRLWCAICPIPGPGEWLQRRGIISRVPGKLRSLGWRWPKPLRNIWLQNAGFLMMAMFSTIILTRPLLTGWLLLGFLLLSVLFSILFKNRVFCRYVCPVGGFIGLYSLFSPLELRVKDVAVCQEHKTKDCLIGTSCSYGCPWLVYPGTLKRNAYCGLCAECIRACPKDNIGLNLRPFGSDLLVEKERRMDEAFKAFIMLSCSLLYSVVLLGPWGWLKDLANMETVSGWALYATGFLVVNLLVVPGLFWLTTVLARHLSGLHASVRRLFVDYAYGLVPLGLAGWIAFSLSFIFVNGSYVIPVLSDPFGWGWDLIGTSHIPWTPVALGFLPALQVITLLVGLVFSITTVYRIAQQHSSAFSGHALVSSGDRAWWATLPTAGFATAVTLLFLWVFLG